MNECLIIIPKAIFDLLQFDETVCDHWHLYAVDYCLSLQESNIGAYVYVLPVAIYHMSTRKVIKNYFRIIFSLGSLPSGYYRTLPRLLKKHKKHFKQIYTTCGRWSTSYSVILQRVILLAERILRDFLRKIGIRDLRRKLKSVLKK